jgi:hypothetical protein
MAVLGLIQDWTFYFIKLSAVGKEELVAMRWAKVLCELVDESWEGKANENDEKSEVGEAVCFSFSVVFRSHRLRIDEGEAFRRGRVCSRAGDDLP